MAEPLRRAAEAFLPQLAARDLELLIDIPDELTATVDVAKVRSALGELVRNAATYAPWGTQVTVCASVRDDTLVVRVVDRGSGIKPEDRQRLVQPFERGSHQLQPVNSRGLGLAIAHTVAVAHGGQLEIEDALPGLMVTLVLPRTVSSPAGVPGREELSRRASPQVAGPSST